MQDAELEKTEAGQEARNTSPQVASPPHQPLRDASGTPDGFALSAPQNATASVVEQLSPGERNRAQLSCGCRDHKQLQDWLKNHLAQGATADVARRNAAALGSLLAEISRWQAPAEIRLPCLEMLRSIGAEYGQTLVQPPAATSLGSGQRQAALVASALFQQLALAYTSVSIEFITQPATTLRDEYLSTSLYRAMDSYRRLIQCNSLHHLATPRQSWMHMQQLFRLGWDQKFLNLKIKDPVANRKVFMPITAAVPFTQPYFHAALFASTNPLQLTTPAQTALWQLCKKLAHTVQLRPQHATADGELLASLRLDHPPIPASRLQRAGMPMRHFAYPGGWALDLSEPLRQLQKMLAKDADARADVLKHAQSMWSGHSGRSDRRSPCNEQCEVALGLSTICHQLNEGKDTPSVSRSPFASGAASSAEYSDKHLVMEVDAIDFHTGKVRHDYAVNLPLESAFMRRLGSRKRPTAGAEQPADRRYAPISATLNDISSGGAGLQLPAETHGKLRCGDLVALTVNDSWRVGTVRWTVGLPDQCRAGIEFLHRQVRGIRAVRHGENGHRSDAMAGLLIGEADSHQRLALPTPLFQEGDAVDITTASGETRQVALLRQVMTNGNIAIFELS